MSACRRSGSAATSASATTTTTAAAAAAAAAAGNTEAVPFTPEELHALYTWVDAIPLSRPKRNIARDFADGCCVAEVMHHYFPRLVELHNYTASMAHAKKLDNWRALNARVFRKLYFEVPQAEMEDIVAAVPGAIERFLRALRIKIAQIQARRATGGGGGNAKMLATSPRATSSTTTPAAIAASGGSNNNNNNKMTEAYDDGNGNGNDDGNDDAAFSTTARRRHSTSPQRKHGAATTTTTTAADAVTRARARPSTASPRATHTLAVPRDVHCSSHHRSLYDHDDNDDDADAHEQRNGRDAAAAAATTSPPPASAAGASPSSPSAAHERTLRRLLAEKDRTIVELRETVGILSEKIAKLEQLVRVKDDKLSQYRSTYGRM